MFSVIVSNLLVHFHLNVERVPIFSWVVERPSICTCNLLVLFFDDSIFYKNAVVVSNETKVQFRFCAQEHVYLHSNWMNAWIMVVTGCVYGWVLLADLTHQRRHRNPPTPTRQVRRAHAADSRCWRCRLGRGTYLKKPWGCEIHSTKIS